MPLTFSAEEARIIGCLIEKSIVTPDQYPLSLNSLTNACNQKSARTPLMSLQKGEIQHAVRMLEGKSLIRVDENFRSSTEKYSQRFCNTRYSDFHFDEAQLALICVLLLRGAQTPGELRTHCRRLHDFADNDAVVRSLQTLSENERGPLVVQLPRSPGRQDSQYMHLLEGEVDVSELPVNTESKAAERSSKSDLTARVEKLEQDIAALKAQLGLDE